ncbi:30S ribosomal protein S8 [Buchnera aphidicola]|uniref:Small ribosomal subunit protein uS8 n=1 Tax=Buchnera aphidicola (Stegophylla sp.) TaxID=2315800 RepID=A0A4D6YEM7_9GAMM|nr:30S ribosomal protein S8 [Buchnera aphidicola (Stegophylla sp.)]QCI26473.1 30S ribosomal protein S8 [Buchnera aphidicola (Stegophylla sp.)]
MSMQDPISDMFTRIRNSQLANKIFVCMPSSKLKIAISCVLKQEGYIKDYIVNHVRNHIILKIILKYFNGKAVIEDIKRISKPSLRVYKNKHHLPNVIDGLGIAVLSTSKGVMSNKKAKKMGIGGEIICFVY